MATDLLPPVLDEQLEPDAHELWERRVFRTTAFHSMSTRLAIKSRRCKTSSTIYRRACSKAGARRRPRLPRHGKQDPRDNSALISTMQHQIGPATSPGVAGISLGPVLASRTATDGWTGVENGQSTQQPPYVPMQFQPAGADRPNWQMQQWGYPTQSLAGPFGPGAGAGQDKNGPWGDIWQGGTANAQRDEHDGPATATADDATSG